MPATEDPRAKFLKCPLCKNQTLKPHCESSTCTWYQCKTPTCDATISPDQRRAHRLDPLGRTDPNTDVVRRVRYKMSDTGWQEVLA